jgi:hypothetical protein
MIRKPTADQTLRSTISQRTIFPMVLRWIGFSYAGFITSADACPATHRRNSCETRVTGAPVPGPDDEQQRQHKALQQKPDGERSRIGERQVLRILRSTICRKTMMILVHTDVHVRRQQQRHSEDQVPRRLKPRQGLGLMWVTSIRTLRACWPAVYHCKAMSDAAGARVNSRNPGIWPHMIHRGRLGPTRVEPQNGSPVLASSSKAFWPFLTSVGRDRGLCRIRGLCSGCESRRGRHIPKRRQYWR